MMYRIACKYLPNAKRAGGGDSTGPRQARGAWVVVESAAIWIPAGPVVVGDYFTGNEFFAYQRCVGVLSFTPRRKGTRCSPRVLLNHYLEQRRHA